MQRFSLGGVAYLRKLLYTDFFILHLHIFFFHYAFVFMLKKSDNLFFPLKFKTNFKISVNPEVGETIFAHPDPLFVWGWILKFPQICSNRKSFYNGFPLKSCFRENNQVELSRHSMWQIYLGFLHSLFAYSIAICSQSEKQFKDLKIWIFLSFWCKKNQASEF